MSDYIPDPRRVDPTDPYRNTARYEYTDEATGRSSYAVVALLGIVALVAGVLMFTGPQQPADQQAQTPPATTTAPLEQPMPRPTPAAPAARPEAPATPPADTAPAAPQQ
ncbi:MAG: hypothetical protein ACT4O6_11305 [Reyranella sp.]